MPRFPLLRTPGLTTASLGQKRISEHAVPVMTWLLLMTLPVPSGMKVALQICVLSLPLDSRSALITLLVPRCIVGRF